MILYMIKKNVMGVLLIKTVKLSLTIVEQYISLGLAYGV